MVRQIALLSLILFPIAWLARTLGVYMARMDYLVSEDAEVYRRVMERRGAPPDTPSFWKLLIGGQR